MFRLSFLAPLFQQPYSSAFPLLCLFLRLGRRPWSVCRQYGWSGARQLGPVFLHSLENSALESRIVRLVGIAPLGLDMQVELADSAAGVFIAVPFPQLCQFLRRELDAVVFAVSGFRMRSGFGLSLCGGVIPLRGGIQGG